MIFYCCPVSTTARGEVKCENTSHRRTGYLNTSNIGVHFMAQLSIMFVCLSVGHQLYLSGRLRGRTLK